MQGKKAGSHFSVYQLKNNLYGSFKNKFGGFSFGCLFISWRSLLSLLFFEYHSAAVDRRYSADDKRGKGQVTGRGPGEFPGPFCFLGSCGRGEKWGIYQPALFAFASFL